MEFFLKGLQSEKNDLRDLCGCGERSKKEGLPAVQKHCPLSPLQTMRSVGRNFPVWQKPEMSLNAKGLIFLQSLGLPQKARSVWSSKSHLLAMPLSHLLLLQTNLQLPYTGRTLARLCEWLEESATENELTDDGSEKAGELQYSPFGAVTEPRTLRDMKEPISKGR